MAITPAEQPRRSMIYRLLIDHGAEFETLGDSVVAVRYPQATDELRAARTMGIADLSPLSRTGFKGKHTPGWLGQQGIQLPAAPNQALRTADGGLVLRLSDDEHMILGDLHATSELTAELDRNWQLETDRMCYRMPRSDTHSWFALTGSRTPEMLSKVCGIDMRLGKFSDGQLAQTSIARINGIAVRCDLGQVPCFYVLADSASADFLWPCLIDAMQEFEGSVVGLDALRSLLT